MIMAYLISIWFLNSFRKGPWMKLVSLAIIAGTCWLVWGALEFKKDFNGGASYTFVFEEKVDKEKLKSALKITDEASLKEFSPIIKAGKDIPKGLLPLNEDDLNNGIPKDIFRNICVKVKKM